MSRNVRKCPQMSKNVPCKSQPLLTIIDVSRYALKRGVPFFIPKIVADSKTAAMLILILLQRNSLAKPIITCKVFNELCTEASYYLHMDINKVSFEQDCAAFEKKLQGTSQGVGYRRC